MRKMFRDLWHDFRAYWRYRSPTRVPWRPGLAAVAGPLVPGVLLLVPAAVFMPTHRVFRSYMTTEFGGWAAVVGVVGFVLLAVGLFGSLALSGVVWWRRYKVAVAERPCPYCGQDPAALEALLVRWEGERVGPAAHAARKIREALSAGAEGTAEE